MDTVIEMEFEKPNTQRSHVAYELKNDILAFGTQILEEYSEEIYHTWRVHRLNQVANLHD